MCKVRVLRRDQCAPSFAEITITIPESRFFTVIAPASSSESAMGLKAAPTCVHALVSNAPVPCSMYILAGKNQRQGASCTQGYAPKILPAKKSPQLAYLLPPPSASLRWVPSAAPSASSSSSASRAPGAPLSATALSRAMLLALGRVSVGCVPPPAPSGAVSIAPAEHTFTGTAVSAARRRGVC